MRDIPSNQRPTSPPSPVSCSEFPHLQALRRLDHALFPAKTMDLSPLSLSFDQHARGQASWSHPASVAARAAALIAGLLGFGSASAHAQVYSEWTGGPLWSDGANWSSGNVTNYGQLEFKGNGTATMDNDLGAALGQWRMYFNGAQSYTLGSSTGQVINLFDNSGQHSWLLSDSSVTQTIGSTQTINFAATSGDTFGQISARGAGDLVLGPIGITGSQVAQLRVAGTSTGKIIFNNVISGTSKQVVIGLDESAVDQANTIAIYKGTNTYDGDTFIVAGQLQVESGNLTSGGTVRLGQTSGSNVATLSLADLDGGLTVARDLVVRAGSSGTKTLTSLNTSGINTHSGGLFLDANLSLVNTAGGTLALTGTALDLKTFTLNASGGGATTISNVISNTGGSGFIVKSGSGSLALSGVNTFTGGVTVNGGTVIASNALALGGAATSTINATGTLQVTGGIVLSNTSLVALNDGGTINSNGTNTVEGKISVGNTGSPSVTVSTTGSGDILTLGNGGNDLSGGTATATINVSGPGTVLASQVSDYLGKWSLTSGVLQLGATAAMGTGTTAVTLNGGSLAGRLAAGTVFTGPAAAGLLVTANSGLISDRSTANAGVTHTFGPLSIGGQTLTTSVGSNVTSGVGGITVGAVTLTGAPTFSTNLNALLTMGAITGTNQNLNFAGAGNTTVTGIIGTGTGSITKTGTGTLTLGGVNTFTGGINANGGLIAFAGVDTALGSVVPINFNGGGISQTAATYTPPAARTFILGAGGGTLDVVIAGSAGKILLNTANTITGTGPLTKTGAGTLQLTQPNNFVGNVAINGGFVEMQNVSGLGSNTVSVNAGGELVASNNNLANPITLNGGVLSANGALLAGTFSGPINVTANSTIGARTFQAQANTNTITLSGALTGSGNLALTTGATVVAASPANVILRSDVSGYSGTMSIGSGVTLLPRALTNMTVGSAGSPGINATYYNFASNVGIASSNFSTTQLFNRPQSFTRTDALISVAQAGGSGEYPTVPVPHFGVTAVGGAFNAIMWKGLLNITSAGTYQFSGTDDDNATLFIDGVNIGSLGVIAANTNIGAGVFLSAGAHSIVYRHTNGTGGGYATLSYNGGAGSDTGANTVLVGSVANSLSTGSLAATVIPALNITGLVATPSVMDIQADNSAASLSFAAGTQFNLTSPTNSNLLITGASTLTGAAVLNNTGASVTYAGAIGETSAGSTFTQGVAGSLAYITNFQGINTYTGLTSVLAGQLNLNATGGNSVSTGGLTVNATNVTAFVNNVQLLQSNQIADTAPVTVTSGILNMGAFNDSVGTLTLNGGQLLGSGTITPTTGVFQSGVLGAGLGGSGGLSKTTTGTLIVSGPSSFTGATAITAGALTAQSNTALGATGGGNGTSVTAGAALQLQGSITSAEEITLNGSGIATTGSLRNLGGLNTLSSTVLLATASTIQSDGGSLTLSNGTNSVTGTDVNLTLQGMGDIVLNSPWSLGTGTVTKAGNGALIFNQNLTSIPAMTWNGGILGFNGTQTLGSVTIGTTAPTAATTWRVNSDPGAGTTITIPTATALIAGYAADQTLLSRISTGSTGTLALTGNNTNALDLSAGPNVRLGAFGMASYSGVLTPNGSVYNFGTTTVNGTSQNTLNLSSALTGARSVDTSGGILNLGQQTNDTAFASLYTGGVTASGGMVRMANDPNLGAASGVVSLSNGATLQIAAFTTAGVNGQFGYLGSSVTGGGGRTINISGSGTLDIASRSLGGGAVAITAPNSITGSGTLTKSGFGQLFATRAWDGLAGGFSGTLNIAANSGQFNIIGGDGYVRNLAGVTVGQSSIFQADNNTALGQARQFVYGLALNSGTTDKIGDTIPISLQGGTLNFQARNVALGIALGGYEKVGAVTLTSGQSTISAIRVGGGGADLVLTNLAHPVGGGTVRFNSSNTIGATGDNGRITLNAVNGTAATTTAAFVGGFATIDGVNFANNALPASVGAAGGITVPTYTLPVTGATPAAALFVTGTIGNTAAASTVLGALGVGQNWPIRALKLSNGAAQTLTFAGTTGTADTIYLESGGLLTDASAFNKTIGATTNAFTRGRLTAGLTTASTPQELFLHHNAPTANPLAIHSVIINNPAGGVVSVVKDLDGLVTLSGTNTYSGGTSVLRGQLQADATGAFGTGAVTVKNARINLAAAGATSSTAGYTAIDQSEISLTGTGINYNGAGDRFNIGAGSIILGPNTNTSGVALNSLTRVSTLTAGGQIVLAPDAIVSHQKVDINVLGSGTQTIQNLGTNADLYYGLSATINNPMGVLTVGAGTPWKGISTDRNSRTFQQGSIVANSDFWLQGLVRDGGVVSLSFGVEQSTAGGNGSFSIINAAGKPINAFVAGTLVITEDSPIQMPGDLTYVLTPGALFQPNRSNSLGSPLLGGTASVIVQGGASLDPGGFVALGVNSNQNTSTLQNLPYPIPSPLNGSVTVEAGGLFQVNDASGIGSAPVGAFTMKTNSVLDLGSANAFFGRGQYALNNALAVDTTGTINPGQFVYEPGAIVRITTDNIYKISQFVGAETNGEKVVYEIAANNRIMTSQNNPFLIPVVGTPTIAPENITIGNGGMFTNDASDRVISEGRGKIVFNDGAVLAATTQTYLTIQEGIEVASGATITIGSTKFIDGMPKMGGGIQLSGPNSNVIPANATINMLDGSQIMFSGTNVWPDTRAISLPLAVAAFPSTNGSAVLPGTGNTLNLNVANFMEYVGLVTGNGAVIANQAGTALAAGYGAVADWTSNVRFINTNNPSLAKTGSTKLTLTGVSTSTGVLLAQQGEVVTSGTGTADWSETRAQRGGKITIDNTTNPLNNRLGTVGFAVGQGGNFELIGNASTAVTETFTNFATGAGGFIGQVQNGGIGVFSITPGTANTTVVVGTAENFLNAGQRVGTWLLRSPSIGNAPGTYTTAGVFVPNVGNSGNGLFQITTPNFTNQGGYGVGPGGNIANSSGSTVMPVRGDYIGDIDNVRYGQWIPNRGHRSYRDASLSRF
jgi:fibronectin-binding autotransporter adhesin